MTDIQSTLDELKKNSDKRTSVFDLEIHRFQHHYLSLGGRLLEEAQLSDLQRAFPDLQLDTSLIRILGRDVRERVHVATNLTGLYERPTFGMPLSSELTYGTELEVLEEEKNWVFTRQKDGYLGWAYRPYLGEGPAPAATHLVLAPAIEVRAQPEETSEIVTRLVSGTGVSVEDIRADWLFISANKKGWIPSKHLRALADIPQTIEEKRKLMVEDAQRVKGIPYLWGGTSGNGIDCSGFARLLHCWVGVTIPRDADMQFSAARPVESPFEVGDLFFFAEKDSARHITHVGVSLGGWDVIHSSRANNGVYIDNVQERPLLREIYVSAGSFLR